MSVELPYSIIGEYINEIAKKPDSDPNPRETTLLAGRFLFSKYSFDIMRSLDKIDSLHKEICMILRDFEPRNVGLLFKALTVEQLILSTKFYVISWTTLADMVAALISKVFNLGFADADVKFDLILRNKHVLNSELPAIFKKYTKPLDIEGMKRHRNEIVHRGRIVDEEVKTFYENQNILHAKRYSLLNVNKMPEEEYKQESAKQTKMLFELASRKQAMYEAHYRTTLEMVAEVLSSLGRKAIELYKAKAMQPVV
ncbi:hypothetical protein EPO44_11710 [bacterium]|nr:MAG: hypothetical protein EPO44_11710 [bacterium]